MLRKTVITKCMNFPAVSATPMQRVGASSILFSWRRSSNKLIIYCANAVGSVEIPTLESLLGAQTRQCLPMDVCELVRPLSAYEYFLHGDATNARSKLTFYRH